MAVRIPALADGTAAADGNPITNLGGYVSNDADVGFLQSDPSIMDSILISGTGGGLDARIAYHGIINDRSAWNNGSFPTDYIIWDGVGSKWTAGTIGASWEHPTATGYFPPKTGWILAAGSPAGNPTLDFDSCWIDDTDNDDIKFKTLTHADLLALKNGTGDCLMQLKKLGPSSVCHVTKRLHYAQGTQALWTESQYNQAVRWAGNPACGAGFDPFDKSLALAGGELIQLDGGEQIELS